MEFAAYINYRGVSLDKVLLATSSIAKDAPCVSYNSIRCQAVSGPAPGDLVIVLPDDQASLAEASVYREPGKLLFAYEPRPRIPHWLYALVGSLASRRAYLHAKNTCPDRWMDGSVSTW